MNMTRNFLSGWALPIGVLLTFSFILSAAETAFTSLSPHQIKNFEKTHPGRMRFWTRHEERVLAAMLIGINAATAGMGCVAAAISRESAWDGVAPWLLTAGTTILLGIVALFFGSILPKALARQNPETWAFALSRPVHALALTLAPLTRFLAGVVETLGGSWSSRAKAVKPLTTRELREILTHSSLPYKSKRILTNIVQFPSLPVRLVMTPREEIFSVDASQNQQQIIQTVAKSSYSRIPVTRGGSLDNIMGIVYSRDLLLAWRSQALIVLEDLLRPVHFVSVDSPLAESLRVFRTGQQHISLVKDRAGIVRGLVTLEDAVEAITC
jgi:putative hemolysin